MTPTIAQYSAYQAAWQYFNDSLFDGSLKPCELTFSRHRGAAGFFAADRWHHDDIHIHEIALNPAGLSRPLEKIMGTLVHEMVHQWQNDHGSPPRKGYHDRQWARKMQDIGLIPSSTGERGGARTGQRMTHYIDPNGTFMKALKKMPRSAVLPWLSNEFEKPKDPKLRVKKIKLVCPSCETPIWLLQNANNPEIQCLDCEERFLDRYDLREWRRENAS